MREDGLCKGIQEDQKRFLPHHTYIPRKKNDRSSLVSLKKYASIISSQIQSKYILIIKKNLL